MTGNGNDMWSHKTSKIIETNDGVKTQNYSVQPEYFLEPYDGAIGVFVHEFGHLIFGFKDLYDTDYSSFGIGDFGLMSFGSWG
jgi:immune inhibitor A